MNSNWPVGWHTKQMPLCQTVISLTKVWPISHKTKQIDYMHCEGLRAGPPLHVCWVNKHGNRRDLHVSAVSCVSRAQPACPRGFSCHSSGLHSNALHSISVSQCPPTSTCVFVFTCMCVSICLLSPAVLSVPLGPVKIKGHFSWGQSSPFKRWKVTRVRSGVRWHWASTQLKLDN